MDSKLQTTGDANLFDSKQSSQLGEHNASFAIDGKSSTWSCTSETKGEHFWEAHMTLQRLRQVKLEASTKSNELITVTLYEGETPVGQCRSHPGDDTDEMLRCEHVKADRVKLSIRNTKNTWLAVYKITVQGISKYWVIKTTII